MKTMLLSLLLAPALLTISAFAHAKPAPVEPQAATMSAALDDTAIDTGPSGAMLESNYFNAPQPAQPGRQSLYCRLQFDLLAKTRLARACD